MAFEEALQHNLILKLEAAGITVGVQPSCDVVVHDRSLFKDIFYKGSLGIGESYVQGKWDSPNLRDVLARGIRAGISDQTLNIPYQVLKAFHLLSNPQSSTNAQKIADHYNTDNTLYQKMLGPEMAYTCAYFGRDATTLDQGQRDKLELVCEKIQLKPGQHVLDIGCGFGSFARFAARQYHARVTGITISEQQLLYGKEFCDGLDVDLQFMNYLDLLEHYPPQSFDHIVSLGMFEHVGPKNYARFMEIASTLLKPDGFFLLHTIGGDGYEPWLNKYIFQGGVLPTQKQVTDAMEGIFTIRDWHNFGTDYARTLDFWKQNFIAAWPELKRTGKFGTTEEECTRFCRMWRYYLTVCEAGFFAGTNQLWQIVLSLKDSPWSEYRSVR